MSNIDKQALIAKIKKQTASFDTVVLKEDEANALLDELEAKDKRNTEFNEALKQAVSGYKSCLRTGYERIIELGGDCDSPEVMIAGNPDIQRAEKLIAAAAAKGE
ncbi:hypothetical protein ASU91_18445 [Enterobacter hormaechei subsp. steigerwaltii]|uniref:ead/Ea22-like family protein n=1 Tax=Enterobacter hormaechei TaxID=158836 RepID=UPI000698F282|nr:ead/Ea22-like family protein [Enterobacter hormaechei]KTH37915.1 hypothetical protein ASV27_22960 [Enterobacter hormaechei subsp. steigerwaltii]KTJ07534.1 hypothetical protein ASU91_18445 [Enterobacter hormaechei subsp. steigerwaltii]HBL5341091.1 ead/Ea22-like family protein [Enterobacter hormaechei]HBL9022477.1 ead/Ea22-like family protein [Enterobacter hormaechei]HBL9046562.1 ead/Ea22-like family protein [Enterobacter hormaechei]